MPHLPSSEADLVIGKCYAVLAQEDGWLRIIDESGEDDLYPATWFVPVALSPESAARLRQRLAPWGNRSGPHATL